MDYLAFEHIKYPLEEPILFHKLNVDAIIPTKGTSNSAGFDLYSLENIVIKGGDGNFLVNTGIGIKLPKNLTQTKQVGEIKWHNSDQTGCYGRIAMRSGLSIHHHLAVSAGVIDIDYEDKPLKVVVFCTKLNYSYEIKKGERFAQLIIETCFYNKGKEVDNIQTTCDEHKGWGSTGE